MLKTGGRFFCLEFSTTRWPGFATLYDAYSRHVVPRIGKAVAGDEDSYRYLVEFDPPLPDMAAFAAMIDEAGFGQVKAEPILGGLVAIHSGWKILHDRAPSSILAPAEMGAGAGAARRAARHRARSQHAAAGAAPRPHRPLRRARPGVPTYAEAFQEIGPAAIKFGQALATRPDLVGEEAAHDLAAAPGQPAAGAVRGRSGAAIEQGLEQPLEQIFRRRSIPSRSAPPRSPRSTARSPPKAGRSRSRCCAPTSRRISPRAIDTYEWAAAQVEAMGGEARAAPAAAGRSPTSGNGPPRTRSAARGRLRLRAARESGRRERLLRPRDRLDAAPSRRVLTLEWIDGIKLTDRDALIEAGHDLKALAAILVRAFLRQAVVDGFFHADLHQGNLFALPDGRLAAIDFGIMGRIDRQARIWLAEILYGLITGNYRRVAEIHFEAQYVPPHHNLDEFATALRAVGEPMRGLPAKDVSLGQMLDGLFKITRDFDMPTQPHLLLLQKTMVMEEGVATALDPDINMWETAEPFLTEWVRSELGPRSAHRRRDRPHRARSAQAARADPPHRLLLPAARRRPARAAAARDRGRAAASLRPLVLTALLAAAAGAAAVCFLF